MADLDRIHIVIENLPGAHAKVTVNIATPHPGMRLATPAHALAIDALGWMGKHPAVAGFVYAPPFNTKCDDQQTLLAAYGTLQAHGCQAAAAAVLRAMDAATPAAPATRTWRGGEMTVADLVNNLQMMDQTLPIYGAKYIEHPAGQRRAIAVHPTVSRERVKDTRWIGEGETLNAAVIWTRAEQPVTAGAPEAQMTSMVDAAMTEMANITPPLKRSECTRLIRAAIAAQAGNTEAA